MNRPSKRVRGDDRYDDRHHRDDRDDHPQAAAAGGGGSQPRASRTVHERLGSLPSAGPSGEAAGGGPVGARGARGAPRRVGGLLGAALRDATLNTQGSMERTSKQKRWDR